MEINMPYRTYKEHYSNCKTLGNYNAVERTITVEVSDDVADKLYNLGNRYCLPRFVFLVGGGRMSHVFSTQAKDEVNALSIAKRWCKKNGCDLLSSACTFEREFPQYVYEDVLTETTINGTAGRFLIRQVKII